MLSALGCGERVPDAEPVASAPSTERVLVAQPTSKPLERRGRTDYEGIWAGSESIAGPVSLCTLVRHPGYTSHGLYRVESLTGYIERLGNDDVGVTYAKLALVEDWYQADPAPEVRLSGGPQDDGSLALWEVGLKVDEIVAVVGLVKPSDANQGYYGLNTLHLFRQGKDGGLNNGQLFTDRVVNAQQLKAWVKGLTGKRLGDACPYDHRPPTPRAPTPPSTPPQPFVDVDAKEDA
jgi:hypothetical protein